MASAPCSRDCFTINLPHHGPQRQDNGRNRKVQVDKRADEEDGLRERVGEKSVVENITLRVDTVGQGSTYPWYQVRTRSEDEQGSRQAYFQIMRLVRQGTGTGAGTGRGTGTGRGRVTTRLIQHAG